jgi:hypothetical protein
MNMRALRLVGVGLLGFVTFACGGTPSNPADPTPTPAPTPATPVPPAPTTSVPQISNLTTTFSSNACIRAADGLVGSALVVTFDYVDGSGDLAGGSVRLNRLYNTGRSESHVSAVPAGVTLIGSPTSGQLRIDNACPLYDDGSSSTETLTLIDANGAASNSLSSTVTRPPGAP